MNTFPSSAKCKVPCKYFKCTSYSSYLPNSGDSRVFMGVIKSGLYCIHTGILSLTEQIMICAADTPHKKKNQEKVRRNNKAKASEEVGEEEEELR